jgi:hypothetical protein
MKLHSVTLFLLAVFAASQLLITRANADDLIGKQLRGSGEQPIGNAWGGSIDATVGPGNEYSGLWCCNTMNVTADQIIIDFNQANGFGFFPGSFNGWVFRDVTDNFRDFFDVRLNPSTNVTPAGLSFNANEIFLNMNGVGFNANSVIVLDVIIPEPSSMVLAAVGISAIAAKMRRRRRA